MAHPVQNNDLQLQHIENVNPFGELVNVNLIRDDNNSEPDDDAVPPQSPAVPEMAQPVHHNDLVIEDIENINQFGGHLDDNVIDDDNDSVSNEAAAHPQPPAVPEPVPQPPTHNNLSRNIQEFFRMVINEIRSAFQSTVTKCLAFWIGFFILLSWLYYVHNYSGGKCFDINQDPRIVQAAREHHCGVIKKLDSGGLQEFPWMSRLVIIGDANVSCAASIIHERFVLTSAHCCLNASLYPDKYQVVVRPGQYNSDSNQDKKHTTLFVFCYSGCAPKSTDFKVEKMIIQNNTDKENNICLVKLKKSFHFSDDVYPICLPTDCEMQLKLFDDDQLIVAGMKEPRKVSVHTIPTYKCLSNSDESLICAFNTIGHRVCNEDSGGPLMYEALVTGHNRHYVAGVINTGVNCSNPLHINPLLISTRVGPQLPWIFKNLIKND